MNSAGAGDGYESDQLVDYSWYWSYLIEVGHPVISMAGEFDQQDGAASQDVWMQETMKFLGPEYWNQDRQIYYFQTPGEQQIKNGGYWRNYSNFYSVTMPKGGHFIPRDYYDSAKSMLDDWTSNQMLSCHNANGCRVNTEMCDAMSNCSGHGTCQSNGQCVCDQEEKFAWKSADCSQKAQRLKGAETYSAPIEGNMWAYVQHESNSSDWELIISSQSNFPLTVYITKGSDSDPNPFSFDLKLKPKGTQLSLTRDIVGCNNFTVSVYCEAYTEITNTAH